MNFFSFLKRRPKAQKGYQTVLLWDQYPNLPKMVTLTVTSSPASSPYVSLETSEGDYQKFPSVSVGHAIRRYYNLISSYETDGWVTESASTPVYLYE